MPPAPAGPLAPPVWPRSAQRATFVLLALALVLLIWHAYLSTAWSTRPAELTMRIDLNRADRAQLLQLPGISDKVAERIEEYRREHNGFRQVDDLGKIAGVGPAFVNRVRDLVYVEALDTPEKMERSATIPSRSATAGAKEKGKMGSKKSSTPKKIQEGEPKIDINNASVQELMRLPNIGEARAEQIVAARNKRPFTAVEDLQHISGIKGKILDGLRPFVIVGTHTAEATPP
jgi:competence protein ComEA